MFRRRLIVYDDILEQEGWEHADATPPAEFNKITHKLAIFPIAIAGFGNPMSEPPRYEDGHLSGVINKLRSERSAAGSVSLRYDSKTIMSPKKKHYQHIDIELVDIRNVRNQSMIDLHSDNRCFSTTFVQLLTFSKEIDLSKSIDAVCFKQRRYCPKRQSAHQQLPKI
ncbi:hypothetical protein ACEPAI_9482 [Sanghuangporus weigelae]